MKEEIGDPRYKEYATNLSSLKTNIFESIWYCIFNLYNTILKFEEQTSDLNQTLFKLDITNKCFRTLLTDVVDI